MQHSKTTLPNGMRVITVPMHDTKSLTLLVLFGTGSKYETRSTSGISHFLEHLFFKGTKRRPRPGQVHQELDDVGAEHNAFTSKELTGYWVKVDSRRFDLALDIVSDILLDPLFDAKEIEKERGVILQEMSMYMDSPMRRVHEVFESLLYGDQPAGWETIGTKEIISSLKRTDFAKYRESQYVGSNAVVIVAGNFVEDTASKRIHQVFSKIKKGSPKPKLKVREAQKNSQVSIEYKDTDQSHVVIGVRGYTMFDEDRYAASLLATILGGKTSSRLFREIREKRGLAYALMADAEHYTDSGYLSVYVGTPHDKLKEVVRRVVEAFGKIRDEGVSERELARAKDFYRGHLAIGLESSDEVASFFGTQELFKKTLMAPEAVMERIQAVTTKDLQRATDFMFRLEKLNVAIIGPHKDPQLFQALLKL